MIHRLYIAYGVEMEKAARQWSTWAGVLLVVAGTLAALWLAPVQQDGRGDYAYPAQAAALALHTLGLFAILVFNANLIAAELASGAIRAVLVRPLYRSEYAAAKLLLGLSYALLLTLLVAVLSWAMVYAFGDHDGVTYGGITLYSHGDLLGSYFMGIAMGLPALAALCAWGIFVSSTTRNPAGAVGIAVGGWLLIDAIKYPLGVEAFVFTTYLDQAFQVYRDQIDGIDGTWGMAPLHAIGASALAFAIFFAGAVTIMNRRSLSG